MSEGARKPARPPYAPLKGVRDFFEKVATKNPPQRVSRDYLASIGVAASNEQHLVAALKFLHLIDESGRPDRHFDVLYLKGRERTRGLQNLLKAAYPSLFTGELDLETATRAEIHDHFVRRYSLHGQMARKATALFTLLCTLAGIPVSPELAREARPSAAERLPQKAVRASVTEKEPVEPPSPSPAPQPGPPMIAGWPMALLLTPDMTEDQIAAFLRRVRRAIARAGSEE